MPYILGRNQRREVCSLPQNWEDRANVASRAENILPDHPAWGPAIPRESRKVT